MRRAITTILPSVEDAFGLAIPEDDVAGLSTVGKLYDYILAHRFRGNQDTCLNSIALHKLRQAMMSILRVPRDAVRESTKVSAVITKRRRRTWRAIERVTGYRLPILRRPQRIVMFATLASIGLGIYVPLACGLKPLRGANVAAIFAIAGFGYIFYWLTSLLAYEPPPDVGTLGELAKATVARNFQPLLAEWKNSPTDAEVWDTLRRIVAEPLEMSPDEITKKTEFSRHLIAG